jgi:aromatic-L-amino-acid decarboxylase
MNPEQFRKHGHDVVDWIADYLENPSKYPVLSRVKPGDIKNSLPTHAPDAGEEMSQILADFNRVIMPGITHWNHPGFLAYFSVTGSPAGILGEMLSAGLNVNGMLWRTSPAVTELEEVVLDWLRQMLGLSAEWRGVITDTASISTLVAIAAAREDANTSIRERGMSGRSDLPSLRLYCSEHTHSSVEKGAIVLGLGQQNVRKIPSDPDFRMLPDVLAHAISEDRAAGYIPFCVVATVGTTSTTSIDPVPAISAICKREGVWLHVDGAYGGVAGIVPEMRSILNGVNDADSFVVNPHKWLFTPIDCSVLFTRRPDTLRQAFSLVPEYLKTADQNVTNYMDWGVQLGRRFRALKLWFVIRTYGIDGLAQRIREHCRLAREFASWVDASSDFERLSPVPFSVVCFRHRPVGTNDESTLEQINTKIIDTVNASGEVFLSHTKLNGRYTIRIAIGNLATTETHIQRAWELMNEAAKHIQQSKINNH